MTLRQRYDSVLAYFGQAMPDAGTELQMLAANIDKAEGNHKAIK